MNFLADLFERHAPDKMICVGPSTRDGSHHVRYECTGEHAHAACPRDADRETLSFPRIHRSFKSVPDLAERLRKAYWLLLWSLPDLKEPALTALDG
jgi:hypothetical protein